MRTVFYKEFLILNLAHPHINGVTYRLTKVSSSLCSPKEGNPCLNSMRLSLSLRLFVLHYP